MAINKTPVSDARLNVKIRARFLVHLAETANVSASARVAGVGSSAVYAERRRSPAFRDAWASPAFNALQLEDYDWVTRGNHGAKRRAVPLMATRLGYPVARQHYFAGFVLRPEDKAEWREIAFAAAQSRARGTAQIFVWALPQVARDGFTYFEIGQEDGAMQEFDDVLFPLQIGREAEVTAEFSTNVVTTLSGHERRNSSWSDARLSYDVGPGVRSESELGQLLSFFRARRGPAVGFRFSDPVDNSSNGMSGNPNMFDQMLGVGDAVRTAFPLLKTYGLDGQLRRITRPVAASVTVALNGVTATGWSLAVGGVINFVAAPPVGAVITAGYRFDVPVRFASDRIDVARATFGAGDMPSIPLVEIREAV